MEETASKIWDYTAIYGINVAGALLILVVGLKVAKLITEATKKALFRAKVDETLAKFVHSALYILLIIIVILAALGNLGIETTSLITLLGAAGLGIGLALQGSLSNVGAGILLIIFKPFRVGDLIQVGSSIGNVEEITVFMTSITTADNKVIIIPNSQIIGTAITNYSKKGIRRVDLVFGIGYEDDLKLAKETILEVISLDPRILKEPEPLVAVLELAASSVNLTTRVWVKPQDYEAVFFDIIEKVKLAFDSKKITIPYPQMTLRTIPLCASSPKTKQLQTPGSHGDSLQ